MALAIKNELSGFIDDRVITNNGDSKKVLMTVAFTVYIFTDKYPDSLVFAAGNVKARTRLYRIGITNHLEEISIDFEVFGYKNHKVAAFKPGIEYEAFFN